MANKIPLSQSSHRDFLIGHHINCFYTTPTSPTEVANIIYSLKNSMCEGFDGLCISPVKETIDLIAVPLSHICNLSFSYGVFPTQLKTAKILPIFKCDDSSLFSNYRPISILPCLSKVFEKLFYIRLSGFLEKFDILNRSQYGFRPRHSTTMAILEFVNNVYEGFENNECAVGIFLDLKKAFDTVNHQILIDKLNFYGIRGTPLAWLTSYLTDRQQYVMVNGHVSPNKTVRCGVPQGSVLGPLLFLLYINDLFHSSNYLSFILFADDTNVFFRHKDLATLVNIVNQELSYVSSWFNANKLTIHPDKSKFIIFHPRRKQIDLSEVNIYVNNTPVTRVEKCTFLGIVIHENLSWKHHINTVCDKVAKVIGILLKSRRHLPLDTLKTLYNSLFLPYINYCNLIWGSTFVSYLEPLYILQKKAIRIITFSPPRTHSKPLFSKLNILSLHLLYKFHVSCFVFSYFNRLVPASLSSLLHLNREFHDYLTRSRLNLHKFSRRYQFAICSQAPTIWNDIPLTLRNSLAISNFKKKLKLYFLSLN